jgi:hypothetical protein
MAGVAQLAAVAVVAALSIVQDTALLVDPYKRWGTVTTRHFFAAGMAEEPQVSVLDLPEPCLLAVLQCLADDPASHIWVKECQCCWCSLRPYTYTSCSCPNNSGNHAAKKQHPCASH